MDFRFTEEQEALRKEVRRFLEVELTPELRSELEDWAFVRVPDGGLGPRACEFFRQLGARGWLGMRWPTEYGGQGRPFMDEFIVGEELARGGWLFSATAVRNVGPAILHHGTEELKREYLPRIARGEIHFALGYTEPQAGTDLAALEIRAAEDGDDYIINGQKVFNTGGHYADYHWLAARTDRHAPRHRGISMFIVDLKSPGIAVRPLRTLAGGRTNEVFYDDVRVPRRNMVGEKNRGWYIMTTALNYERLTLLSFSELWGTLEELVQYARETQRNGLPLAKDPLVRHKLAEMAVELEAGRVLAYRAAWMLDKGIDPRYEASIVKVLVTELAKQLANTGMQILGLCGLVQKGSRWAALGGRIEQAYRATVMPTFGAGSNEILRNMIAISGLGLPRE